MGMIRVIAATRSGHRESYCDALDSETVIGTTLHVRTAHSAKEVLVKKLAIAIISLLAIAMGSAAGQSGRSNDPTQPQQSRAQAFDQLNMDAVPELDEGKIWLVQQALQNKGFDPGPIDGILGPLTREAVRRFQDRYGMEASGVIDNQTLFALGQAGLVIQMDGAVPDRSH
jgi:Putative peptidoglycan binding domain